MAPLWTLNIESVGREREKDILTLREAYRKPHWVKHFSDVERSRIAEGWDWVSRVGEMCPNIQIIGVPEDEDKKKDHEKIL